MELYLYSCVASWRVWGQLCHFLLTTALQVGLVTISILQFCEFFAIKKAGRTSENHQEACRVMSVSPVALDIARRVDVYWEYIAGVVMLSNIC